MADDEAVLEFLAVMRRLRAECPWKAAQTHRSLARYLLEEAYETVEALDTGDATHLREELGDLLLQVFLHAAIAEQAGDFTMADVARDITEKMYRRNPHVFGDVDATGLDPAAVNEVWESRKAEEKQRTSVTEGLPPALPALLHADKVLDRLERSGRPAVTDADDPDLGDRLLSLVAEARASGTDPEQALRDAVRRRLP
ncbi:MazG family protein [Nocardioides euryhalodurans]|nr:MazG family protein [Nocardioides euryhalodurans]